LHTVVVPCSFLPFLLICPFPTFILSLSYIYFLKKKASTLSLMSSGLCAP
jgi:hypothetical protein